MVAFRLALFGGFEARLASGGSVSLRMKKAQALLAYLGLRPGQAHHRDKLAALLWGERSDEHARDGLRHALVILRKGLSGVNPPSLLAEGQTLALDPAAVEVDVATFERRVAEGTPEALERAAEVYRGDLLLGLSLSEPLFEDWLVAERERLREMALEVLARLLAHQTKTATMEPAIRTAIRLLALDPLQEAVHRALMHLYHRQGRRGAALRQYQLCVSALQRELGVEPEVETKQLYQELLRRPLAEPPRPKSFQPRPGSRLHVPERQHTRIDVPAADVTLVGRDAELAALRQTVDTAGRGEGRVAVILGEAGIGKSALLGALAAYAFSRGATILLGRAHESDQILAFGPWVEALRAWKGLVQGDLLGLQEPIWRAELARLLPELDDPGLPPTSGGDLRLFEAVTHLIERISMQGMVVVMLEDLHWADEMSLRLLAFLSRRLHRWRVLVATTAREEELEDAPRIRRTLEHVCREGPAIRFALSPLSRPDTSRLVGNLAQPGGGPADPADLADTVWRVSEGNPLVAVETMRALQQGVVVQDSAAHTLPQRVLDLVASRLERLSEDARQLAGVAAVIGREFEFAFLQRASGLDEEITAAGVEELVRRRVLQGIGERFDFTHDRVRTVVYGRLLLPRRKLLHRRVAEVIEALHAADLEAHVLGLGQHYREGEVWEKAEQYLRQAGLVAVARSAYREAARCFEDARVALNRLPESADTIMRAVDLRLDLGEALLVLGEFSPVLDRFEEAESLAQAVADQPRLGRVWSAMSLYYRLVGEPDRAIDLGRRALGIARALGDPALEARTNYPLGLAYRSRGDYRQAASVLTRNVDLLHQAPLRLSPARVAEDLVLSHIQLCIALSELGEMERALEAGEEAMRLARTTARPDLIAGGHLSLGIARLARGELDAAIEALGECCRLSRRWELRIWRFWAQSPLGDALVLAGQIDDGVRVMEESVEEGDFLTHSRALRVTVLAHGYLRQGRLDTAHEAAQRGLHLARRHGEQGHEAWALRLLGELGACGEIIAAAATLGHYRAAMELAEPRGMLPLVAHCHLGLGKLYRRTHKREQAQEHLTTATTLYREMDMRFWLEKAEAEMRELTGPSLGG